MLRFDPTSLANLGRLAMVAKKVVEGFLTGVHRSPYKGASVEFAEHRQYFPGDEIRHIDWRVYGKTDRYYVKEFEEETNLKAWLLLDASGSMAYRGKGASKFDYARYVAASLAYLMMHQMDAVGLLLHDHRVRQWLQPRSHSKHLMHLLQTLEATEPGGETSLAPLWHRFAERIRQRGMIVILSDCFEEIQPLAHALRRFAHGRHEILLFHILAPEEIEFPFSRWTQFRNLERSADRVTVDPRRLRAEYLERFAEFRDELRRHCTRLGIDYQLLRTDEPVEKALGTYLAKRMTRR